MKEVMIDVRERDEFDSEHVANSINVPLSQFSSVAPGVLSHFQDSKITIMCRSGKRAKLAKEQAFALGFSPDGGFHVYEGGILKWKEKNKTVSKKPGHLPILRQVHLVAGLLGGIGVALGFLVSPLFFLLSGFVSVGMFFAGASGTCLMAELLQRMPWNKFVPEVKREVCVASTGYSNCELKERS